VSAIFVVESAFGATPASQAAFPYLALPLPQRWQLPLPLAGENARCPGAARVQAAHLRVVLVAHCHLGLGRMSDDWLRRLAAAALKIRVLVAANACWQAAASARSQSAASA